MVLWVPALSKVWDDGKAVLWRKDPNHLALPNGRSLKLIKPRDPAVNSQKIRRRAELHPEDIICSIRTVGDSTGLRAQVLQRITVRKGDRAGNRKET